jgi:hypothetical protein
VDRIGVVLNQQLNLPQGFITQLCEPNEIKENKRHLFLPEAVFTPTARI